MKSTKLQIEELIKNSLNITNLIVEDLSHLHAGHKGVQEHGGGHFQVNIVSKNFEGKTLIARHRMINEILMNQLEKKIHALGIKALTPEENK